MDFNVGGKWRFVHKDQEGQEYAFRGEYKEIVPYERLVYTFEWEGLPGHILTETLTFENLNGKTRVVDTSVYATSEDLEGMTEAGMEEGAEESFDKLEELLAS